MSPRTHRGSALVACVLALAPGPVLAADAGPGKTRLQLDTGLVSWTHVRAAWRSVDDPPAEPINIVGFGLGRPTAVVAGSSPYLGFGVGYRLAPRVVLGARFGFSFGPPTRSFGMGGWFSPYFELSPIAGKKVLPFMLVRVGIAGGGGLVPSGGIGGGVHIFPVRAISLDLGVNFDFLAIRRSVLVGSFSEPHWTEHGFILGATVGLSLWL